MSGGGVEMEMEGKLYRASIDWGPPLRLSWSDGEAPEPETAVDCGQVWTRLEKGGPRLRVPKSSFWKSFDFKYL